MGVRLVAVLILVETANAQRSRRPALRRVIAVFIQPYCDVRWHANVLCHLLLWNIDPLAGAREGPGPVKR
jgi:hypothetical protein